MDKTLKTDTAGHRERLQAELLQVTEALRQAGASAATVVLDQSSVGRVSRMDAMQQQAMAKGMQERLLTRHRKLTAALARVDAGSYGLCCECLARLEDERLEADPAAVFCQDCAEERERP